MKVLLADYLTETELARELGVHQRTLARWRRGRCGPPYTQVGGKFFYRIESVRRWLLGREVDTSARRRRRNC